MRAVRQQRRQWALVDCQHYANVRGGRCLSKNYRDNVTKMQWICQKGHHWSARWGHMAAKGCWCPKCFHERASQLLRMDGLQIAAMLARKHGGKCLSTNYTNNQKKLLWECRLRHRFEMNLAHVKDRGSWCPECALESRSTSQRQDGLSLAKRVARKRGGKCLSESYRNSWSSLEWQCKIGHQWKAALANITHRKSWCPTCGKERCVLSRAKGFAAKEGFRTATFPALQLARAQKLAERRGGKCLSDSVPDRKSPVLLKCKFGHLWTTTLAKLSIGRWCRICARGRGERIVRLFFEQMLGQSFPPVWPEWLRTNDGHKMQLDGCCERLKIAFEHQGRQHSRPVSMYGGKKAFRELRKRDLRKRRLCRQHGMTLISVPAVGENLPVENLQVWIAKACRRHGISLPRNAEIVEICLERAFVGEWERQLQSLQEKASQHGGRCLSKRYLGSKVKLKFECALGHTWPAVPANIKSGHWCPRCAIVSNSGENHYSRRKRPSAK